MIRTLPAMAGLALLAAPVEAQVGLASSARTVVLTATSPGSVGITLPGGSAATLPAGLRLGANDFAPLPIETSWDLDPTRTSAISVVAFFQAPGEVQGGVPGGTLMLLFSQPISAESAAGHRTDQLQMRIDLTGWPDRPAGTYQGTLNLLAITQ
jgi:hypothetical protein